MALLPPISRSFLQRLTHPSPLLRGHIQMQSGYFCQLHFNPFPQQVFLCSSSSPPRRRVSKETFQVALGPHPAPLGHREKLLGSSSPWLVLQCFMQ